MKKVLLSLALLPLGALTLRADVIFVENFNYVTGPIVATGTNLDGSTNWFRHSGSASPSDAYVKNNHLENSATGGTVSRQDDVNRPFCNGSCTYTSSLQVLYASFTVNCTNLPTVTNYFAHFVGAIAIPGTITNFQAKVFALPGTQPGTWRLGAAAFSSTVNKVYPADLARDVDYQVVIGFDPTAVDAPPLFSLAMTLWVNPSSVSDTSVTTADAPSPASQPAPIAYGLRQASGAGNWFCYLTNLAVATTYDEAATNVWNAAPAAPVVLNAPQSRTNFVGDAVTMPSLFTGQGLGNLTYQWQKNGANVANVNGNSNTFAIASAAIGDTGNYRVIATAPNSLSTTSAAAFLWVTNPPVPPTISSGPSNISVFYHQSGTLHVDASGPPPLSYTWYFTNAPITHPNMSGDGTDTLTISDVTSTNDTAGPFYVVVSNPFGSKTSAVATVTAAAPPAVSVAYLRTLVDANYNATNTSPAGPRWQITGTVTTFTNLTTANTSSYFLWDGTAGINIFVTGGQAFRPALGDVLTFIGFLSSFNSTLELEADTNDVSTSFIVLSNNVASLPAPTVIPFAITNDIAYCEKMLEGRVVMLTNVYFGESAGTTISTTANTTVVVTNAAGETFNVFFSAQDSDTAGQTLPSFAWSVIGIFNQALNNTATPRNSGYQVAVTRFSDIVTDAPPAVTATVATGGSKILTWTAVPYNYSYSVLATRPGSTFTAAAMSGANENPTNASPATGSGSVAVSPDGGMITVDMSFSGLSAPATAAHIHGPAGVGTNASVLFPFSGVPAATSGAIPQQSFSITPTQLGYLYGGLLYMNVHDANFPGGEIRDQLRFGSLTPTPVTGPYLLEDSYQATMLGVNEVPVNVSTATGFGTVALNADQTIITVNMKFSGLSVPATAAHIHGPAGAGTNASVLFPFSGVPAATSGAISEQTFAITPTQVGYLQSGQLYMNVHNATYPGGEIRAQIVLSPATGLTFPTSNGAYVDKNDTSLHKFYKIRSP